ncbi:MAG: GNAT family N-acetyltransferase [Gemmatimonadota bacterium]
MTETFRARPADETEVERASLTDPGNPFLTVRYLRSQKSLGREGWLLSLENAETMLAAALTFLERGRLRRTLTIPSSPPVSAESPFWPGVRAFIGDEGITDLEISTFASPESTIPPWPGELDRIDRTEFAMQLKDIELLPRVSKSHRERISKGRKKGLIVRRDSSDAAIDAHIALHINSMDRRKSRGEDVSLAFERAGSAALLTSGAGELFQAMLGDHVASSLLILRSLRGAYSESSGNSKEGMNIGASHFLRYESALALQSEGVEVFYLGGVRPQEEGLRSFKAGFGTTPIDTQSISAYVGGTMRRRLSSAIEWLQSTGKSGDG